MLNLKPYIEEIEDIEPGQTVRINHTDCEAGEDTRRRLYLTRTHADETRVIAYCHNCQQGGRHVDGQYTSYRNQKHNDKYQAHSLPTDIVQEPAGLIGKLSDWPTAAQSWAYTNKLNQGDASWYGIKYDPSTDRVYLPRCEEMDRNTSSVVHVEDTLVGYQLRSLYPWHSQPKYITAQCKDAENYTFILPAQRSGDYVVIVEDLVSAIHIIRATEDEGKGANLPGVYVNYGTRVDPRMMYNIAHSYKHAVVWLDNDNQHVNNQAKLMQRTIRMYSDQIAVSRVTEYSDPKHYKPQEICRILDEVQNG